MKNYFIIWVLHLIMHSPLNDYFDFALAIFNPASASALRPASASSRPGLGLAEIAFW